MHVDSYSVFGFIGNNLPLFYSGAVGKRICRSPLRWFVRLSLVPSHLAPIVCFVFACLISVSVNRRRIASVAHRLLARRDLLDVARC